MRFLIISAQYLPRIGGIEVYTHGIAAALCQKGHAVTVLTTAQKEGREANDIPYQVLRLPAFPIMDGRYPCLRKNRKYRQIVKHLDEETFDAVVINTRFFPLSVWGAGYSRKRGITPLVLEHGTGYLPISGFFRQAAVTAVEKWMTKRILRSDPRFAGTCRAAAEWLRQGLHIPAEETVIYNCADHAFIDACKPGFPEQRFPAGTEEKPAFRVFFSGRLIEEKGLTELIRAMQSFPEEDRIRLYIAGDGPLRKTLEKAGKNVVYLGGLSHEETISALKMADVFCFPSYYPEAFTTAVQEAGSCGIPVIATCSGGLGELLADENRGYILERADADHIQSQILEVRKDPEEAKRRAENLKVFVRGFDWERTAEDLVCVCRKINTE